MMLQPVSAKERIASIDILRGFSLFGILLVNCLAFYIPLPHVTDLQSWFTSAKDIILTQYIEIYVQSSFYPLFSMLFGYGIAMQFEKANSINARFYPFAMKRFGIMFVLGAFHAIFIWWGDILSTYAFCGMFLLLFIRVRPGWLFGWAIILNGLYQAFYLLILAIIGFSTPYETYPLDLMKVQQAITAYGTGGWSDAFAQRLQDLTLQFAPSMWIMSLFTILPYMLFGAALSKWKLIEQASKYKKVWITSAVVFVGMGLFIKNAPILFTRTYLLDYLKVYVGGPILAFGYIALIVCLCLIPRVSNSLSPLAKLGRMSLTMYLLQSIVLSIIFYNFGFGLYGEVDVMTGIYICIGIILVQIVIAELWFMKFKQGPIEYLMKKLTYGRKILSEK